MQLAQAQMLLTAANDINKRIDKLSSAVDDNNIDLVEDWVDLILDGDDTYRKLAAMALELMLMPISASSIATFTSKKKSKKERMLSLENLPHREELEDLLQILKTGVRQPNKNSKTVRQILKILLQSAKLKHHLLESLSGATQKLETLVKSPKIGEISKKLDEIPSDVVANLHKAVGEKDWVGLFHILAQDVLIPWVPDMIQAFTPKSMHVASEGNRMMLEISNMQIALPQAPAGASVSVGEHSQFKRNPLKPSTLKAKEEWVSLAVETLGVDIEVQNASFVFQKKTFPRVQIAGHMNFSAADVTLDTQLRLPVASKDAGEMHMLQVSKAACKIGNLVVRLAKDVKHSSSLNKLLAIRHSKILSQINAELQDHFAEVLEKHITALNLMLLQRVHLVDPLVGQQLSTSHGTGKVISINKATRVARVELAWSIPGVSVSVDRTMELEQ